MPSHEDHHDPPQPNPDRDPIELYRWAVQDPETHAALLTLIYQRLNGSAEPKVLREDFAGNSADSVAWAALGPDRLSVAVDVDGRVLAWAASRAARVLGEGASRVRFVASDARAAAPPMVPHADVLAALNFSVCYFHERVRLVEYFRHALTCLAPGGIFVMNIFGGTGVASATVVEHRVTPTPRARTERPIAPFTYRWQQGAMNPVSARIECRIHFRFDDGPPIENAFVYDWRLWMPVELIEALREAGFSGAALWRHTHDPARGPAGVFLGPVDAFDPPPLWSAYIVAQRPSSDLHEHSN